MAKPETEVVHLRLDKQLLEQVKRLAQAEDRTYINMIAVLVKEAIDGHKRWVKR